jgi:hypothetical protein
MVDYYTDPGELRAHAKQYAAMYATRWPGERFDINKLGSLHDRAGKLPRFIWGLHDPIRYSQYWDEGSVKVDMTPYVARLKAAYVNFYKLMDYFVNQRIRLAGTR